MPRPWCWVEACFKGDGGGYIVREYMEESGGLEETREVKPCRIEDWKSPNATANK